MNRHRKQHPDWEQMLAADDAFRSSVAITIEEEEKLGVPEGYQGRVANRMAEYDARRGF
ncbi:hypothetical protein CC1G_15738 [Coprinopsis cinerea okayama7|uniref:Uncharacterized protein n=1 Tax=Coprinopsis cinerea (strain Okayama-7 / 130 / ATCC MYA-4618 / FGSC 9003) TaxID=240176 RepID=D6RQ97_COPC7|nr:hypothetical protein CC1G_15738 [Coprinopsis cinerea okayama7\|eukprot:XP_002910309.1 hypothetical protein CC1G_15738 [Coprinopsis cinerea okayama7\